jgi:hypothetical protein
MIQLRHQRTWLLIAAIAVGVALLLTLLPSAHADNANVWLVVLPVLFVGLLLPLSLLWLITFLNIDRAPASPVLPASFQRPPPSRM